MNDNTLFVELNEICRISAFGKKQEPDHVLRYDLLNSECWMDDSYDYDPGDEIDDDHWMDDLDEAA